MDDRVTAVFTRYGVNRQVCTRAALIVREDSRSGRAMGVDVQGSSHGGLKKIHPHDLLDRALSILKHIPEGTEHKIIEYAHGTKRGRPGRVVYVFLNSVPDQAWIDMSPVASDLI